MANGLDLELKLDSAEMRDLERSQGVLDDLLARAERVAESAGDGMEFDGHIGKDRARANVWTATFDARLAEAHHRALTRAIDAARG